MNYKTRQKDIIYKEIVNNKNDVFTAKSLINKLDVSKATLYRFLEDLCEKEILKKIFNELKNCYEYQYIDKSNNCDSHLHLVCESCGKVTHLKEKQFKVKGFNIDLKYSIIKGICDRCLKKVE